MLPDDAGISHFISMVEHRLFVRREKDNKSKWWLLK
jgi:hypothetical protein